MKELLRHIFLHYIVWYVGNVVAVVVACCWLFPYRIVSTHILKRDVSKQMGAWHFVLSHLTDKHHRMT